MFLSVNAVFLMSEVPLYVFLSVKAFDDYDLTANSGRSGPEDLQFDSSLGFQIPPRKGRHKFSGGGGSPSSLKRIFVNTKNARFDFGSNRGQRVCV